jgi:hypothetical protein
VRKRDLGGLCEKAVGSGNLLWKSEEKLEEIVLLAGGGTGEDARASIEILVPGAVHERAKLART